MKFEIEMRMSKLKDFESLVGVISRNPSENRSVKSFPPPEKKKMKNTNKSSFGSNKTCFLHRFCWGFWPKNHPFGDLQLLTKTAGV